jgi:pimeloyl-ACP methyl ester carboxylesterase
VIPRSGTVANSGFSYSTGNPIAYSALLLRQDLAYAEQSYHFKQAILIGHSMGGILSRLQVTNTGRVLWDGVFGPKADALYAPQPPNSVIKQALIFSANPTVKRVVFIATPHRGSSLSTGGIGALDMRLIRLPFKVLNAVPKAVIAAVTPNNDPRKFRPPNSIPGCRQKIRCSWPLISFPSKRRTTPLLGIVGGATHRKVPMESFLIGAPTSTQPNPNSLCQPTTAQ